MSWTTLEVCWRPLILTLYLSSHFRKLKHLKHKKENPHASLLLPFKKKHCWKKNNNIAVLFNLPPHVLDLGWWTLWCLYLKEERGNKKSSILCVVFNMWIDYLSVQLSSEPCTHLNLKCLTKYLIIQNIYNNPPV